LLGVFATLALVLAAVGIYGVMAYAVRQRTREIGTRMAVGATRPDILWLVMRQGALVGGLGIGAGLLIGLAATRSLRSVLFGVSATDPLTLLVATAVLLLTTLLACYIPARRASAVDPARTLSQP
jgi:putative ABC transport system permease protein